MSSSPVLFSFRQSCAPPSEVVVFRKNILPEEDTDCHCFLPELSGKILTFTYEYTGKGLDHVISAERIIFWDDLHPQSDICSDTSGSRFTEALQNMFPPRFDFHVTPADLQHLRQLIFPVVKVGIPVRTGITGYEIQSQRLKTLDHNQETIARKYDSGHRILTGPSGSGKTIVLVHKAAFLKHYNPAIRSILFVCFNITLVNYIRRLLTEKKVPLGDGGVEVFHFFELCSRITGVTFSYESEGSEFYALMVEEALKGADTYGKRYDAILVDEGQDFSDDMYRVVTSLLNPKTNSLTIALDDNQNIYRHRQKWKDVGVQAQGRVHRLTAVYRNTEEITGFASRFISGASGSSEPTQSPRTQLFEHFFDYHGPSPELKNYTDFPHLASAVSQRIAELHDREEYPYSEIAIIYTMKMAGREDGISLPQLLAGSLESRGIMWNWASEDYRSKKSFDITTNSVAISTIHSVKGLDFACVFLVGLDLLEPGGLWSDEQIRSLAYVGMTRARYYLSIPYVQKTGTIHSLTECTGG